MTLLLGFTRRYSLLLLWLLLISSSSSRLTANAIDLDNDEIRRAVALWLSDQESAEAQYGPVEEWSTWQVTDLSSLFQGAATFDANLNRWDVSSVTDMKYLFAGCQRFNSNLNRWNVQQVTDFSFAFSAATNFTGESLEAWKTDSAVTMEQMFVGATSFVGPPDIGLWNVSHVTSMRGMFLGATSFDRDPSGWDMSSVELTDSLLEGASSFSQRVCWDSMHPNARFFQAFCGTQGGFDVSPGKCPTLLVHPSIIPYSRACDPTDYLQDIVETQVFRRPEEDLTGGLGAPDNSLVDVDVDMDDRSTILQLPQDPANNADDKDDEVIVIAGVQQDVSAAASIQRLSLVPVAVMMMMMLAGLTGEYLCQ